MTLLTPLGLIGLLGIAVLILIYIIKPNYQQKMISSTYVWKLSLRYKRKKIPVSKLRNLLIILCQIFILTACATILAQPNKILKNEVEQPEVIAIIDASASMRTEIEGESRFERAVTGVISLAEKTFDDNGIFSIILADTQSVFLTQRVTMESKDEVLDTLYPLIDGELACSYGTADIEGAMDLCENVLLENPFAKIKLFTDTQYYSVPKEVEVMRVVNEEVEWNAAILGAEAVRDQNYYAFYIDVACYGYREGDPVVELNVNVNGANAENSSSAGVDLVFTLDVPYVPGVTKRVVFINEDLYDEENSMDSDEILYYPMGKDECVSSYQDVHIYLNEEDNFAEDNSFNIFGGQKEVIRVQYFSTSPNIFFSSVMMNLQSLLADKWAIEFVEVKVGKEPEMKGFDFYIFEHAVPSTMPRDGVVLLADPTAVPSGAGFRLGGEINYWTQSVELKEEAEHVVLEDVETQNITVSKYTRISSYDTAYEKLMSVKSTSDPALLVRNDPSLRVAIMPFSVHYSNIAILKEFPILMYNIFNYFIPETVERNSFEVYESVTVNARGAEVLVTHRGDLLTSFDMFPATLKMDTPGTYILTQTTYSGKTVSESIHVKIPEKECNIFAVEETLKSPYNAQENTQFYKDLLLYIAAALVAVLFLEWWLQSRESM